MRKMGSYLAAMTSISTKASFWGEPGNLDGGAGWIDALAKERGKNLVHGDEIVHCVLCNSILLLQK